MKYILCIFIFFIGIVHASDKSLNQLDYNQVSQDLLGLSIEEVQAQVDNNARRINDCDPKALNSEYLNISQQQKKISTQMQFERSLEKYGDTSFYRELLEINRLRLQDADECLNQLCDLNMDKGDLVYLENRCSQLNF